MNFYKLPKLPYPYDALEPHIDAQTMKVHHDGHHKTYVEKLNTALKDYPNWQKPVDELLASLDKLPADLKKSVEQNGGGHANHTLFWTLLSPTAQTKPDGEFATVFNETFGSLENFKEGFNEKAEKHFASGWAWLAVDQKGKLQEFTSKDHESPNARGMTPLLVVDLWEHAYYLKHQNKRADYLKSIWNVLDWKEAGLRWQDFKNKGTSDREWKQAC